MKALSKAAIASLIGGVVMAGVPIEVQLPVDNVFVPFGFDSNDNSEVIISGLLPNLCHKSPYAEVSVNGNKIDIKMKGLRYDASNPYCPEMVVPFVEKVELGILNKGNYEILVNGKSPFEYRSEISVMESSSNSIDEDVYARVDRVDQEEGSRIVRLKGYNPSDCYELDEIKVMDNKKDVYSVLPKMRKVSSFCPMKMVPFSYEMEVPKNLKADKVLLHVRVMNGKSVNSLFSNADRE